MKKTKKYSQLKGTVVSVALLALTVTLTTAPTRAQVSDSLYIGDDSDFTVKRFDAASGAFLGAFVKSTGGLHGPRGLIFDSAGELIVSDQNVNTSTRGDILQYDTSGKLSNIIVSNGDENAPGTARGMVLWNNNLFVADFTTETHPPPFTPGRLLEYTNKGKFLGAFSPPSGVLAILGAEFHPRGVVVGPDGFLYVSNVPRPTIESTGHWLGGQVFRFSPAGVFVDVFINSTGGSTCNCANELNRPEGLVFGPDGNLYITSFRNSSSTDAIDNDKILIFQGPTGVHPGSYVGRIDLDTPGPPPGQPGALPRAFAQALLFGPSGFLFVPISGNGPDTGSVRRFGSTTSFTVVVPASVGGPLGLPVYLTFGKTDPATLVYP